MVALSTDAVHKFLAACEGSSFRDALFVALHTGMRRSELLALKWEYVDLERGRLQVVAGLHRIKGEGLLLLPVKTKHSRRSVSISSEVVDVLRQIQRTQLMHQSAFSSGWNGDGFVFADELGNPIDPARLSREFGKVRRAAGIEGVRLHDLRHTHATLMLQANVHPKVVSERLGHASVQITMDIDSHIIPGLQEDAADRFAKLLEK